MNTIKISLATQIKEVIGYRILFCSLLFTLIIAGLTFYDLSISMSQLKARINEQVKPIEDFAINQAFINNLDTIQLKIDSFNESTRSFHIDWIHQGNPNFNKISWHFPFSWNYNYAISALAGYQFGYFKITGSILSDKTLIYELLLRLILLAVFIISVLGILYPLSKKIPEQLFINPINRFLDLILTNSSENKANKLLPIELQVLENKILDLLITAKEHERNKAALELVDLSVRLAHDIHSPLGAMELGLTSLSEKISNNEIAILKNGIQSVRDIANNVLERYRKPNGLPDSENSTSIIDNGNAARPLLLFSLTETILSQKKYEWHHDPCKIELFGEPDVKTIWIYASPNEIKRLLSNLLNNAYEALIDKSKGIIQLNVNLTDKGLILKINDNGIGVPKEKLSEILNGFSSKHSGKGLGLSSAKEYIEKIDGKIKITSEYGTGTTIDLIFQRITNPSWFQTNISLHNISTIVVLEDDFSMLMYWEQRISELGLTPKLFSEYKKAHDWLLSNINMIDETIFIADYELSEKSVNGLMFLESISNSVNRYLITSHGEELYFQEEAARSNVWLIPKSLVSEISFAVLSS